MQSQRRNRSRVRRTEIEEKDSLQLDTQRNLWNFPTDSDGTFARAMSAIACNAEAGAKGVFNLVSRGEDSLKEQVTQTLA